MNQAVSRFTELIWETGNLTQMIWNSEIYCWFLFIRFFHDKLLDLPSRQGEILAQIDLFITGVCKSVTSWHKFEILIFRPIILYDSTQLSIFSKSFIVKVCVFSNILEPFVTFVQTFLRTIHVKIWKFDSWNS